MGGRSSGTDRAQHQRTLVLCSALCLEEVRKAEITYTQASQKISKAHEEPHTLLFHHESLASVKANSGCVYGSVVSLIPTTRTGTEMTLLTAIIFNFYTMAWEPFPQVAPEEYGSMEECVVEMNDINAHMESQHSALRVVCIKVGDDKPKEIELPAA